MATAATRFTIAQFDEMIEKGVFGFSNKRRFELLQPKAALAVKMLFADA